MQRAIDEIKEKLSKPIIPQIRCPGSGANREKVIKEYEDYVSGYISLTTSHDYEFEMHKAVLAILKEQEAVKPKNKVRHGANAQIQHFCGNCNTMLHGKPKFCSECGRPVKWE